MPRAIDWIEDAHDTDFGRIVDAYGRLGPITAFSLCQCVNPHAKGWLQEWKLTSHFIPSRERGKTYRSIEDGKRACEGIVAGFAQWLAD